MGAAFCAELIGDGVQIYFGSVGEVMALYHTSYVSGVS
jgi:hypothetical protein